MNNNTNMEGLDKVKIIVSALEDKKAENIKIIDISEISTLADYFVITNGTNKSQTQALADNVEEKLAQAKVYPKHIEGYNSAEWILFDYSDILVHIFNGRENRDYYDLERIWRDGKSVEL